MAARYPDAHQHFPVGFETGSKQWFLIWPLILPNHHWTFLLLPDKKESKYSYNLTNFHLWIHLTAKSHKNYWTPSMKLDEGCVSTQNSLSDSSTWARQGVFSSCFKELCMGIESEYELRRYALYWLPFFLQTSSVTWSTRRDLFTLWFLNFKNYMWESQYGLEDI